MKQVQENGACQTPRRAISDKLCTKNERGNAQSFPPLKLSESLSRLVQEPSGKGQAISPRSLSKRPCRPARSSRDRVQAKRQHTRTSQAPD